MFYLCCFVFTIHFFSFGGATQWKYVQVDVHAVHADVLHLWLLAAAEKLSSSSYSPPMPLCHADHAQFDLSPLLLLLFLFPFHFVCQSSCVYVGNKYTFFGNWDEGYIYLCRARISERAIRARNTMISFSLHDSSFGGDEVRSPIYPKKPWSTYPTWCFLSSMDTKWALPRLNTPHFGIDCHSREINYFIPRVRDP